MTDAAVTELVIERPAAGGRMIGRQDGRVVFVAGAIPGERVRVRIERQARQMAWATVTEVLEPSDDRREVTGDPACGGTGYAHIRYARQLALKAEVIADAFRRIGRLPLSAAVSVRPSPEHGYRLRARFHIHERRAVFFREGTHDPCDPAPTGQVTPAGLAAVAAGLDALAARLADCAAVVLAENVAGTERVLHFEPRDGARFDDLQGRVELPEGVSGMTTNWRHRPVALAGSAVVTDTAEALFGGPSPLPGPLAWTRHASSFFQGNRFLTGDLVRDVLEASAGERVVDLYAGVGLFACAMAARGAEVVAVEGDRSSAADLAINATPWEPRLRVVDSPVEQVMSPVPDPRPDVVVVDPPRTGMSPEALAGLIGWRAPRVVYVSCDPATLARDGGRLATAGYTLSSVAGFDLFPTTPHVETLAVFDRRATG